MKAEEEALRMSAVAQLESPAAAATRTQMMMLDQARPPFLHTRRKRGTIKVVTPELVATMDHVKMTDREATHVLGATAHALGQDVGQMAISRSAIRRARVKFREDRAKYIPENFASDASLVLHWDGKILPDITGREKVDRLPILVSGNGNEQLISVPKLPSGTGKAIAEAVVAAVQEWGIENKIGAMCFDTTATNTGYKSGACELV